MLSVSPINAGQGGAAAAYYEGLAKEDYYTAGGEPPGKWVGRHAETLGLDGQTVQPGQLTKGLEGYHPETGEALAKNAGEKHKPGWDFTFSAPKSVSTVWITASDEQRRAISAAQQRAVERALEYAEGRAFHTRTGHAGEHHIQHTDGIAAATFEHSTSRNGDPQLHTHAIVLNLTPDGKRMDFDSKWKMSIGAAYRTELAAELQKLGYAIERDGTSFRIAGVPKELEKELSTRRAEIEASLKEKGLSSAKAAAVAALDTRQEKGEVSREQLVAESRALAEKHGFSRQDAENLRINAPAPEPFDRQAFAFSVTAEASTLTEMQLQAKFFQASQTAGMTIGEAQSLLEEIKRTDLVELVDRSTGETHWTTREMLEIERGIADTAERWHGEQTHAVRPESLAAAMAAKTLSEDQKQALEHIMRPERVSVVQGLAGAGKSYMLDAARDAWQRDGYTVLGCALSGKAALGLKESSGMDSDTIHGTLIRLEKGAAGKPDGLVLTEKSIVVMDEAGMTGSRLMRDLQKHVDASGAKLVLVGDTRQLQPVDNGGAMRSVKQRIGAAEMNEIRRQKTEREREKVKDFAEGRAALAIEKLEADGHIKISETAADVRAGMAAAVISDMKEGKTSIAAVGTNKEGREINELARAAAKDAGLVRGPDNAFEAELGQRQFAEGDRIIFLQNDRRLDVWNGTTGTVEKAEDGRLQVKLDNGKLVEFDQERYNKVDHGYAWTVHKSQGVTVDTTHYLPGRMSDLELNYVACSRHRETVHVHGTAESIEEFKRGAHISHAKDTSADYLTRPESDALKQAYNPEIRAAEKQLESFKEFEKTKTNYNKTELAEAREKAEARLQELKEGAAGRLPDREKLQQEFDAAKTELEAATTSRDKFYDSPLRGSFAQGDQAELQERSQRLDAARERFAKAEARLQAVQNPAPIPTPQPARFEQPKRDQSADIKRDADLARAALETTGKMPEGKTLKKDIEKGNASWTKDSQGERYLQYRDGRTFNPQLHGAKRETELRNLAGLGMTTKTARVVDKHLIDTKILGKRIQAIKTGTKVLIGREDVKGRWMGKQKDLMHERHQRDGKGGLLRQANDHLKNKALTKGEGWREASFTENIRARLSISREGKADRAEARERLEGKIKAAEAQAQQRQPQAEYREPTTAELKQQAERARDEYVRLRDHPEPNLLQNHERSVDEARERLDKAEERYSSAILSDMAKEQHHAPPPPAPEQKQQNEKANSGPELEL